jgi:hypothetical protein
MRTSILNNKLDNFEFDKVVNLCLNELQYLTAYTRSAARLLPAAREGIAVQ